MSAQRAHFKQPLVLPLFLIAAPVPLTSYPLKCSTVGCLRFAFSQIGEVKGEL